MKIFFMISFMVLLFNQAMASRITRFHLLAPDEPKIVSPSVKLNAPRVLYNQELTKDQLTKLSQEALKFLQTEAAFEREVRLNGPSLRQHILKYHVIFNNMIPRYGDQTYIVRKSRFVSQCATGSDVIKMLQEKIATTTVANCRLSHRITDGVLYLKIQIPVVEIKLFYYNGGEKLLCSYIDVNVRKVWLGDHWSRTLGASTIFPNNKAAGSQVTNHKEPDQDLIQEYQTLEKKYDDEVNPQPNLTNTQVFLLDDEENDEDSEDSEESEEVVVQEKTQKSDDITLVGAQVEVINTNGQLVYQYANGDRYAGVWGANKPNGEGTMTYANGGSYTGAWIDGKPHGNGTMNYADGSSYAGKWAKGLKHGKGVMKYLVDGVQISSYDGEFKDGKMHGLGKFTYANGDVYEGRWAINHPKDGTMKYADGGCYQGKFIAGEKSSGGVMIYPNHDRYQGSWRDDKKHGSGVMMYADGRRLTGIWHDDELMQSHELIIAGRGVATWKNGVFDSFIFTNGDKYQGGWQDDQPHGLGKLTVKASGYIYESTWEHGEMQLTTDTKFTNKRHTYQGQWLNNQPHGIGKMIKINGEVYDEATWIEGQLIGIRKFTDTQGNKYEVDWNAHKSGPGKCIGTNQEVYEGMWINGKLRSQFSVADQFVQTDNIIKVDPYDGMRVNGELGRQFNTVDHFVQTDNIIKANPGVRGAASVINSVVVQSQPIQSQQPYRTNNFVMPARSGQFVQQAKPSIDNSVPLVRSEWTQDQNKASSDDESSSDPIFTQTPGRAQNCLIAWQRSAAVFGDESSSDKVLVYKPHCQAKSCLAEFNLRLFSGAPELVFWPKNAAGERIGGHKMVEQSEQVWQTFPLRTPWDHLPVGGGLVASVRAIFSASWALKYAAWNGNNNAAIGLALSKMLPEEIDCDCPGDCDGNTALMLAAYQGDVEIVELLLPRLSQAGINRTNNKGATALMLAAQNGHAAVVRALIARLSPAEINFSVSGITPLILAVHNNRIEVVKVLLTKLSAAHIRQEWVYGKKINPKKYCGGDRCNAMMLAQQFGYHIIEALLREKLQAEEQ